MTPAPARGLAALAAALTLAALPAAADTLSAEEVVALHADRCISYWVLDGAGRGTPVETGQMVVLRDGAPLSWMQAGYLKKAFLIVDDPATPTPTDAGAEGGVLVLPPDAQLSEADPVTLADSGARQRDRVLFTNAAGTMTVGLWDTEAMTTEAYPFPCHEFAMVLDGAVTIEGEDGQSETFGPGDCFFIPAGTITRWHVPDRLCKYYATVEPATTQG